MKLGPTGAFLYGTYLGGSAYDWTTGIAVDTNGNVYVSGGTTSDSGSFPQTAGAYDLTANSYDAFLSKFDAAGTRVYSTFFGGSGGEQD